MESSSGTPSRTPQPAGAGGAGSLDDTAGSPPLGAASVISSSSPATSTKPAPTTRSVEPATKPAAKPAAKPAPTRAPTTTFQPGAGAATASAAAAAPTAEPVKVSPDPVVDVPVRPPVAPTPTPAPVSRPTGPRRARLLVTRLDPWSVMKTAFMLSISIGIVLLMATALLWWTLSVTGVFAAVGRSVDELVGSSTTSFDFVALLSFSRVMGVALVLAAVEIVLVSALTTLFAFLYNLSVGLTGGLEVTLSEDA